MPTRRRKNCRGRTPKKSAASAGHCADDTPDNTDKITKYFHPVASEDDVSKILVSLDGSRDFSPPSPSKIHKSVESDRDEYDRKDENRSDSEGKMIAGTSVDKGATKEARHKPTKRVRKPRTVSPSPNDQLLTTVAVNDSNPEPSTEITGAESTSSEALDYAAAETADATTCEATSEKLTPTKILIRLSPNTTTKGCRLADKFEEATAEPGCSVVAESVTASYRSNDLVSEVTEVCRVVQQRINDVSHHHRLSDAENQSADVSSDGSIASSSSLTAYSGQDRQSNPTSIAQETLDDDTQLAPVFTRQSTTTKGPLRTKNVASASPGVSVNAVRRRAAQTKGRGRAGGKKSPHVVQPPVQTGPNILTQGKVPIHQRRRSGLTAAHESTGVSPANKKVAASERTSFRLTDFFPVRRSGRVPETQIKHGEKKFLEKLILSGAEDGLKVEQFPNKGRGVVATKIFQRGDFVVEYRGKLYQRQEALEIEAAYSKDPSIGSYMYFFIHKGRSFCIDATEESPFLGRLVNHSSKKPNCHTKPVEIHGCPYLILVASQQIFPGEEFLYDYGERSKEAVEANPWLISS